MFENLSQREKILLIIAFLLIVLAVYYFYLYQPMKNNHTQLKQEISKKSNRLETARNMARKLPALEEEYKRLREQKERNSGILDQGNSTVQLLKSIEDLANKNGVKFSGFSPSESENKINVEISLQGNYNQICSMFADFNELSDWLEFKKLELKTPKEVINVAMSVILYKEDLTGGDNS